jgi:hypothetical protein
MTVNEPYETGRQIAAPQPAITYLAASHSSRTWLEARDRYDELTQRDLSARARATLVARGEYDPAKHGSADPEPLTLSEYLEVLASGEVVARVYRHPYQVHQALEAGATWQQIADATGISEDQARREYREFAEGQHKLWTGELGGRQGRFGMDDDEHAAAIARAAVGAGPEARSLLGALTGEQRALIAEALAEASRRRDLTGGEDCGACSASPVGVCEAHAEDLDVAARYRQLAREIGGQR